MTDDSKLKSSASSNIVATWLVADAPGDEADFPQVGGRSSTFAFQAVYWRCVACFFGTLMRQDPNSRRMFFTNVQQLPVIDGIEMEHLLREWHVEIIRRPITYRLKHPAITSFGNQFYILDVLDACRDLDFDCLAVLDSDCIWTRPTDEFFADLQRFGVLTLELAHRADELINGATRQDLKLAAEKISGRPLRHHPHYVGGEIFACSREKLAELLILTEKLWKLAASSTDNRLLLREEAHLLSVAYDLMGIPPGTADAHIKRMWTTFHFHNVTREDIQTSRCIWHLPAEKKSGFSRLFREVTGPQSRFWHLEGEEYLAYLATIMGVPRRSAGKFARDLFAKLSERASAALSRL